jgi:long-chain acyl-CoA synthetase
MTQVAAEHLALQRLYHWEKTRPSAIYMSQPMGKGASKDFTWAETVDQSRRMAAYLKSFGWEPGTRIGIMSKNCAHWIMSDYAIWMAGFVSVPLYPTLTAETVRQIMEHSEMKACFIGKLDDWTMMKPGVPASVQCISYPLSPPNTFPTWDDIIAKTQPIPDRPLRKGDDLATIIYTSGTTGLPKGVMHNFNAFAWTFSTVLKRVPLDSNDRMLSYLPLSHVAERTMCEFGSLASGCRIYFSESLETFPADLRAAKPTIFFSVPRLWVRFQQGIYKQMPPAKLDRLLKIPVVKGVVAKKILTGLGLDQCRIAIGGAAPMPAELLNWFKRLGLEVIEAYGMTENCAVSHANVPGRTKPGTVGTAYDGIETRIAPDTGEIQIRAPNVMLGYYKAPDATKAAMTEDGWLRTGDKGAFDSENRLRITGRVKDLFKSSKGKYIAPGPIEDKLINHSAVEACCVAGANFGQPFGLVMLSPDATAKAADPAAKSEMTASFEEHRKAINATLDPHEHLDFIAVVKEPWSVENGMLTPTFKIKRNKIEDVYGKAFETWASSKKTVIWQ